MMNSNKVGIRTSSNHHQKVIYYPSSHLHSGDEASGVTVSSHDVQPFNSGVFSIKSNGLSFKDLVAGNIIASPLDPQSHESDGESSLDRSNSSFHPVHQAHLHHYLSYSRGSAADDPISSPTSSLLILKEAFVHKGQQEEAASTSLPHYSLSSKREISPSSQMNEGSSGVILHSGHHNVIPCDLHQIPFSCSPNLHDASNEMMKNYSVPDYSASASLPNKREPVTGDRRRSSGKHNEAKACFLYHETEPMPPRPPAAESYSPDDPNNKSFKKISLVAVDSRYKRVSNKKYDEEHDSDHDKHENHEGSRIIMTMAANDSEDGARKSKGKRKTGSASGKENSRDDDQNQGRKDSSRKGTKNSGNDDRTGSCSQNNEAQNGDAAGDEEEEEEEDRNDQDSANDKNCDDPEDDVNPKKEDQNPNSELESFLKKSEREYDKKHEEFCKKHGGIKSKPFKVLTHPLDRSIAWVMIVTIFFTVLALLSGLPLVLCLCILLPFGILFKKCFSCSCFLKTSTHPGLASSANSSYINSSTSTLSSTRRHQQPATSSRSNPPLIPATSLESYWLSNDIKNNFRRGICTCLLYMDKGLTSEQLKDVLMGRVLIKDEFVRFRSKLIYKGSFF